MRVRLELGVWLTGIGWVLSVAGVVSIKSLYIRRQNLEKGQAIHLIQELEL